MGLGQILPVHPDIDENARRTGKAPDGVKNVLGHVPDHADQIRERHGRNQGIIRGRRAVRETEAPGFGVDSHQLIIEFQVPHRDELFQVGHEAALAGIPEMRDVMNLGRCRRQHSPQHLLQRRPVDARSQPIGAHIIGAGRVVFSRVLHGKEFRKTPAKA